MSAVIVVLQKIKKVFLFKGFLDSAQPEVLLDVRVVLYAAINYTVLGCPSTNQLKGIKNFDLLTTKSTFPCTVAFRYFH